MPGNVLSISAPVYERVVQPFTINDDPRILYAVKPKTAILIPIMASLDSDEEIAQVRAVTLFVQTVLDTTDYTDEADLNDDEEWDWVIHSDSSTYVNRRLNDPEDDWDIETLIPVVEMVTGLWYERPTGSQQGSPGNSSALQRSRGRGTSSTAASRSRASTQKLSNQTSS